MIASSLDLSQPGARHPTGRSTDLPLIVPSPDIKPEPVLAGNLLPAWKEDSSHFMGEQGIGPIGHRDELTYRGKVIGEIFSPGLPPGNGTPYCSDTLFPLHDAVNTTFRHQGSYHHHPSPPKLDFPPFDGENPKTWQLKCENYFRVCSVHPEFMISIATMYFVGEALLWLQSSKAHTRCNTWETFADADNVPHASCV